MSRATQSLRRILVVVLVAMLIGIGCGCNRAKPSQQAPAKAPNGQTDRPEAEDVAKSPAKADDLYRTEVNVKGRNGGKDLVMVLEEIERHEKYSLVRVSYTSGASVPSIMFIVRGMYEMAKLRDVGYFTNLKEWEDEHGNQIYKIGFAADNTVDPKTWFGDDVDLTKDLGFMSVKDFSLIFEDNADSVADTEEMP